MKKISKVFSLGAVCSLMFLFTACGSGETHQSNSSNNTDATDTSALDTGSQYGQQPRDSVSERVQGVDTSKKTGTSGNAHPSGRPQDH